VLRFALSSSALSDSESAFSSILTTRMTLHLVART
jgi:hypothetical protein